MPENSEVKPSYTRLLTNRSLSLLWVGQLVSQSGDFIFDVALLWYVLISTHSPFFVGVTLTAELLPHAVVGPIAGVYVDRFNRKTVMLVSNLFQALVTFALALLYGLGLLSFPVLIVLVFLLMAGGEFFRPALSSTIPRIASQEDLLAANGLFAISTSVNQLAGFGLGGIIVAVFGVSVPIYYDGFTFLFAAALFSLISSSYGVIPATGDGKIQASFAQRFLEGIRFIRSQRVLIQLVVIAVMVNFFGGAAQAFLAPYAQTVLRGDSTTFGYILASFSSGLIVGSLVVGRINAKEHIGAIIFLGIAIIGAVFGLLGVVSTLALSVVILFAGGVANAIINLPIQALIQVTVPPNLMGRVFTSLSAFASFSQPIATAFAGGIVIYTSIQGGLEIFGVMIIALTIVMAVSFADLRRAHY